MGSSVALDLGGLRSELDGVVSRGLGTAALAAKKEMEAVARRATGSGRMSGVGRKGARLGAGFDYPKGSKGLTVKVYANGPWQLIEYGRKGGYRIPKRRGTGPNKAKERRNAPRLNIGGNWVTGPVKGGSARGRAPWGKAFPEVLDGMGDELAKGILKALEAW